MVAEFSAPTGMSCMDEVFGKDKVSGCDRVIGTNTFSTFAGEASFSRATFGGRALLGGELKQVDRPGSGSGCVTRGSGNWRP
jgi:hypothetical protein